jgi:hypothetical protein
MSEYCKRCNTPMAMNGAACAGYHPVCWDLQARDDRIAKLEAIIRGLEFDLEQSHKETERISRMKPGERQ